MHEGSFRREVPEVSSKEGHEARDSIHVVKKPLQSLTLLYVMTISRWMPRV